MTVEQRIGRLLRERRLTVATAESCTGGLIGHRVTAVPGCSAYYRGGVVAYANDAKTAVLGVPRDTLRAEGAVSGAVALAMARGVRRRFAADIGLGVTGVAGPTGGTRDKPVGCVWIGLAAAKGSAARSFRFSGDRTAVKRKSAMAALGMLEAHLRAVGG